LFIEPQLAAGITSGAASASARKTVSTIRWEVSTFPAATAAGKRGFTSVPSGAWTVTGRIKPALAGISPRASNCKQYRTAAQVTAKVAFTPPRAWGAVPLKSNVAVSPRTTTATEIGKSTAPKPSSSNQSVARNTPSGNPANTRRNRCSEYTCSPSIAASTAFSPTVLQSSCTRRIPQRSAANCASKSPRRSAATRVFASNKASTSWRNRPR